MIFVGIDDTDTLDSRGTNQLAKTLAAKLEDVYRCQRIVRHQLLVHPLVPYTSKNGAASLVFETGSHAVSEADLNEFSERILKIMRDDFIPGSDPGVCIATHVESPVIEYSMKCQTEIMSQTVARQIAREHNLRLSGVGGTEDGVIGALAAVGMAAMNDSGRVVYWNGSMDDVGGNQPLQEIQRRDIEVREQHSNRLVDAGWVDVGKRLRPNWSAGRCVLFVERQTSSETNDGLTAKWRSLKLP